MRNVGVRGCEEWGVGACGECGCRGYVKNVG